MLETKAQARLSRTDGVQVLLLGDSDAEAALWRERIRQVASDAGIGRAESVKAALRHLQEHEIDVTLVDFAAGDSGTLAAVHKLHAAYPRVPVIAVSQEGSTSFAMGAGEKGAVHWIAKSRVSQQELKWILTYAVARASGQRAIDRARSSLMNVVESSADAMVVIDLDGTIMFANSAAEQLFGRTASQLQGAPFGFPLVPEQRSEIQILGEGGEPVIAEMMVVETEWRGDSALLATLRDVTEKVQLRKQLEEQSIHDSLTGLYNRRGFTTLARKQLQIARRKDRPMALIFVDLDDMKSINDRFGHETGDKALDAVATVLTETFRKADIEARIGGDEFVVLAVEAEPGTRRQLLSRLHEQLQTYKERALLPFTLSVSTGIAFFDPDAPCTLDELIAHADEKMYEQKAFG